LRRMKDSLFFLVFVLRRILGFLHSNLGRCPRLKCKKPFRLNLLYHSRRLAIAPDDRFSFFLDYCAPTHFRVLHSNLGRCPRLKCKKPFRLILKECSFVSPFMDLFYQSLLSLKGLNNNNRGHRPRLKTSNDMFWHMFLVQKL